MATYNSGELLIENGSAPYWHFVGRTEGNNDTGYYFTVRSRYDSDENVTGVVARAEHYEDGVLTGEAVKGIDIDGEATIKSWSVEANDTTADVYVDIELTETTNKTFTNSWGIVTVTGCTTDLEGHEWIARQGGATYGEFMLISQYPQSFRSSPSAGSYGVSEGLHHWNIAYGFKAPTGAPEFAPNTDDQICHVLWQGGGEGGGGGNDTQTLLVGRFAIDLHDAGGTGPDSPWNDPGDYDEDRDPEDPTTTLYLTVTGALSGRHNDPLNDTNYSYVPADRAAQTVYGSGGDGGNGGGGGAGASTIIVRKFGTDKADSKNLVCKPKRHGYGSGGGAGAKGGDGCILIFW